jgi:endonuclease YncB( thermonuclease family)
MIVRWRQTDLPRSAGARPRLRQFMLALIVRRCLVLGFLTVLLPMAARAEVVGKPDIIDGSTIIIAGRHIALYGIAAPPISASCSAGSTVWHCGEEATFALADMIGRTWVTCQEKGKAPDGELRAVCYVGGPKGKDLGASMVAEGWALARPGAPDGYAAAEAAAKAAGHGIWRGGFTPPTAWRGNDQ